MLCCVSNVAVINLTSRAAMARDLATIRTIKPAAINNSNITSNRAHQPIARLDHPVHPDIPVALDNPAPMVSQVRTVKMVDRANLARLILPAQLAQLDQLDQPALQDPLDNPEPMVNLDRLDLPDKTDNPVDQDQLEMLEQMEKMATMANAVRMEHPALPASVNQAQQAPQDNPASLARTVDPVNRADLGLLVQLDQPDRPVNQDNPVVTVNLEDLDSLALMVATRNTAPAPTAAPHLSASRNSRPTTSHLHRLQPTALTIIITTTTSIAPCSANAPRFRLVLAMLPSTFEVEFDRKQRNL